MRANPYQQGLGKNPANYAPLTPLSFLERAAYVYPDRPSVIHGGQRYTWKETYQRARRLASGCASSSARPSGASSSRAEVSSWWPKAAA